MRRRWGRIDDESAASDSVAVTKPVAIAKPIVVAIHLLSFREAVRLARELASPPATAPPRGDLAAHRAWARTSALSECWPGLYALHGLDADGHRAHAERHTVRL
jgi:hypothetical protein